MRAGGARTLRVFSSLGGEKSKLDNRRTQDSDCGSRAERAEQFMEL